MEKESSSKLHERNPNTSLQRYNYIDSLRGLAILSVLIAHISLFNTTPYPLWLKNITEVFVGPRGVQLFYVVSSFTLCLSFSKRKNIEKHPLRNFYIRRFFRIAPLFYFAIVYYLWQQNYWNHNPNQFSMLNIITTFTFTNGISSDWINNIVSGGWSIAIESTFYLLFPLLFYKLKTIRFALVVTFITAVIMQFLRLYLLSLPSIQRDPFMQTYTFQFFPSQLPVFLIGISVFLIMHEHNTKPHKRFITIFLISLGGMILIQELLPLKMIAGHYFYSLCFGFLLYFLAKFPLKLLVNPVTVYIGKISFSLYLCHQAVYYWLNYFGLSNYLPANPYLNFTLRFFLLLLFSSIVASILFFTIEKYGIILGKKIINRHEKVAPSYIKSNIRTF